MAAIDEIMQAPTPPKPQAAPDEIEFVWATYHDGGSLNKWGIDPIAWQRLLEALGFARYDEQHESRIVRVTRGSVVEETTKPQLIDAVMRHIINMTDPIQPRLSVDTLRKHILERLPKYFSDDRLNRLGDIEPVLKPFQKDGPGRKFMYFKNGYLEISKDRKEFRPYTDLEGSVWKDEILPREWTPAVDWKAGPFAKFMKLVAGTEKRFDDLLVWFGYYMHSYNQGKRRALVLTDSAISSGSEANGRSGKSLLAKGLGYALAADPETGGIFVNLNGKDFDPASPFKYQSANSKTRLVALNDLKANFSLENLYNDVTEGIRPTKKGKEPVQSDARLMLITNRTVNNDGGSSRDRFVEFEITAYFSDSRTPQDEFGHWFFSDWKPVQWAQFDNLMAEACQRWLKAGKHPVPEAINLNARKLREQTAKEFVDWMDTRAWEFAKPNPDKNKEREAFMDRAILLQEFKDTYTDFAKLSMRKFMAWFEKYTNLKEGWTAFNEKTDIYKNDKSFYICVRRPAPKK